MGHQSSKGCMGTVMRRWGRFALAFVVASALTIPIPGVLTGVAQAGQSVITDDAMPLASADMVAQTGPYAGVSQTSFAASVSDIEFDESSIISDEPMVAGPVFAGDYAAYLQGVQERRAEAERAAREAEEARIRAEQEASAAAGAASEAEIDSNIAHAQEAIELPAVSVPEGLSDLNLPADYMTMTQAAFAGKSTSAKIELMGALARRDMAESGILASVTMAQAILESGWMESGLARYNALFGIKACALKNNWADSPWDGSAKDFKTGEEYTPGTYTTITAAFRTYPNVWASIKDHSAYLTHARKGSGPRYPGIVGNRDPLSSITIIKNGGYATSSTYIDSIIRIIRQYDLTRFDG